MTQVTLTKEQYNFLKEQLEQQEYYYKQEILKSEELIKSLGQEDTPELDVAILTKEELQKELIFIQDILKQLKENNE